VDIEQNIKTINQKIEKALEGSNYESEKPTLICVTKNADTEDIKSVVSFGLHHLGENRVQEMLRKYNEIDHVKWHLIGNLQRNKVKYIIDKVAMIHSLDSLSLAREINKHASLVNLTMPVLIQVNVANEASKSGLPYEEVIPFIESVFNLDNIKIMGLMMIAPLVEDAEQVRQYFRILKQLFDDIKRLNYPHIDMQHLSMGMTNDFEVALTEGSNMIRVGTGIFGKKRKVER